MTLYYINIGNDVAKDVHCDIIVDDTIVMSTYHDVTMHIEVATTLTYDILLCPIRMYIKQYYYILWPDFI